MKTTSKGGDEKIMDKKALKLLSMFALPPVMLGRCGRYRDPSVLERCLTEDKCEGVEEHLRTFRILYPYLRTINKGLGIYGTVLGLGVFSYKVAEAYWLGNSLLRRFKPEHYQLLLGFLKEQGTPEDFLVEVRQLKLKSFIPTHLFQLLFVSSKASRMLVRADLSQINNCMVRPGVVIGLENEKARVLVSSLSMTPKGLILIKRSLWVKYNRILHPTMKVGCTVAVHWKWIVRNLTAREYTNLIYWTKRVIKAFNEQ